MPSISIRKSIRWGSDPPGENTSTLVLTSRAKNYVDVRIYKSTEREDSLPTDPEDERAVSRVEWAFAGQSKSTPPESDGEVLVRPAHTVWSHWVDSTTLDEIKDEGDMYSQTDGTVLEKGAMAHPATGLITNYEEVWQDIDAEITGSDKSRVCRVLRVDHVQRQARGMVIRIGDHVEGLLRVGDGMTVVRWQWRPQPEIQHFGTWVRTLAIGNGAIPCESLFFENKESSLTDLEEGASVIDGSGMKWTCVEAFEF